MSYYKEERLYILKMKYMKRIMVFLICLAIIQPQMKVAATPSQIVFSKFGREAVFATQESVELKAAPYSDSRTIEEVELGEQLWRVEEDYRSLGWDKLNRDGYIVYCESSLLSDEDPTGKTVVTTNKKYYENMKGILVSYGGDLQAAEFQDMSHTEVIEKVAPLCVDDMKRSGILASVTLAQFILESGYGKSGLAIESNNCFGMKADLSGNDWPGSAWDGVSYCEMNTGEQMADGTRIRIVAPFRKYACVEESIADHSAYLAGALSGRGLRYPGLVGCTDYKEAVRIIKDGGYATSHDYVQNVCAVIEKWDLTRFDKE